MTEFLGSVNVLRIETVLEHGPAGDERPLPLELPGPDGPGSVYVRPHDLDVTRERNGRPAWPARIAPLTPLGGTVRLELTLHDGTSLHVQLTRERCLELYLAPRRGRVRHRPRTQVVPRVQAFVENYVI